MKLRNSPRGWRMEFRSSQKDGDKENPRGKRRRRTRGMEQMRKNQRDGDKENNPGEKR